MSLDYVRRTYNVPAKKGGRVAFDWQGSRCQGTITAANHHVTVRPDDKPRARLFFHPTDLEYLK
jgi:hypothetical protein